MERMIGNCLFFKKDDNTKIKKNASFFWFFLGKERGRILPSYPRIGVLANSCVIICTNFVLKLTQKDRINLNEYNGYNAINTLIFKVKQETSPISRT